MNRTLAELRAARAVELSLGGLTYQAIADQLGFRDRSGAWRAVRRCLGRRQQVAADSYVSGSFAELEILIERNWARATAGDLRAGRTVLQAIEGQLRLAEVLSTLAEHSGRVSTARRPRRRGGAGPRSSPSR